MNEVKVKKAELLVILGNNRAQHRALFEKALEGYREEAISALDKALNDAKNGRKIRTFIQLDEPVDQTKDYDRAIGMLEMCVDDEITITSTEYQQYVLDDWRWKDQFLTTNSKYIK